MRRYFWPRLHEAMLDRGVTQAELLHLCEPIAAEAGIAITRSNISRYCRGLSIPRKDKMAVLAKALDVDVKWLSGDGPDDKQQSWAESRIYRHIDDALHDLVSLSEDGIRLCKPGSATYTATSDYGGHYIVTVTPTEPSDLASVDLLMQAANDVVAAKRDIALLSRIARALVADGVERDMLKRLFPTWDDAQRQRKQARTPKKSGE